jgi:hypothetical protein
MHAASYATKERLLEFVFCIDATPLTSGLLSQVGTSTYWRLDHSSYEPPAAQTAEARSTVPKPRHWR